jgi:hypothetical protein
VTFRRAGADPPHAAAAAGRLATFGSTALSSLTNAALGVFGAAILPPSEYAVLALALTTVLVLLPVVNGFTGEVALVGQSRSGRASTAAFWLSAAVGLLLLVARSAADIFFGPAAASFRTVVLFAGVSLPITCLHQAMRYEAFAGYDGMRALRLDLVWASALGPMLMAGYLASRLSVPYFIVAWAASAMIAVLVIDSRLAYRTVRRPHEAWRWLTRYWRIGGGIAVDHGVYSGSAHALTFAVAASAPLSAVAGLRLAQFAFGPLNVMLAAARVRLSPTAADIYRGDPRSVVPYLARWSAGLSSATIVFSLAASHSWPTIAGLFAAGTGMAAAPYILPVGLASAAGLAATGPAVGLRVAGRASDLVRGRLTTALLSIGVGSSAALLIGPVPGAWAFAGGATMGSIYWWHLYMGTG